MSLFAAIFLVTATASAAGASGGPAEVIDSLKGVSLSAIIDRESVHFFHCQRPIARYRYGGEIFKPYLAELHLPGGPNLLLDAPPDHPHHHALMLATNVNGVELWGEFKDSGRELHLSFDPLRLATFDNTEAVVLTERLRWVDAEGGALVEERRTLTVLAPRSSSEQLLLWESYLSPAPGLERATLMGRDYHGLGLRLLRSMDSGGTFLSPAGAGVEGTNGKKAPWCAYSAEAAPDLPATAAIFDAPGHSRSPTAWFTMNQPFAYLSATHSIAQSPVALSAGERYALRFGVALLRGRAEAQRLEELYQRVSALLGKEEPLVAPGLMAHYTSLVKPNASFFRLDRKISFDWRDGAPDERLPAGPYRVEWRGRLLVPEDGSYRFELRALGQGEVLVDGKPAAAGILSLDYGYHDLSVRYPSPDGHGAASLHWTLEGAPPEVVPARALFHDAPLESAVQRGLAFERGRLLAARSGCEGCHGQEDNKAAMPQLGHAAWLRPEYLERYLFDPQAARPGCPMPACRGSPEARREEARAIAAFLRSASRPPPPAASIPPGSAPQGRDLFLSLGCIACHDPLSEDLRRTSPPEPWRRRTDPTDPPSLAEAGSKWSFDALFQLLARPSEYRPLRDMPDFQLEEMEAANLAAWLVASKSGVGEKPCIVSAASDSAELIVRGRRLFAERGCSSCHAVPGLEAETPRQKAPGLAGRSLAGRPIAGLARGCLSEEDERPEVPRFALAAGDLQALSVYYENSPPAPVKLAAQERAARAVREERRCLSCHERDGEGGEALRRAAPRAGGAAISPAVNIPPDLSGAGARLKLPWIQEVLAGQTPRARPWLGWRMPRFAWRGEETAAMASFFSAADAGLPIEGPPPGAAGGGAEAPSAQSPPQRRDELRRLGPQLLGPEGFNCQYCHFIGPFHPGADTLGPDLTLAARRLERRWFLQWIENPRRFRPGTPMPAFVSALPGILGGDLEAQKRALWQYLEETPAEEISVRLLPRRALEPEPGRPLLVQARVRGPGSLRADRGIAVALPPGPSLLFDAGRLSWLGGWSGAFLERAGEHGAHAWWQPRGGVLGEDPLRSPPVCFRSPEGGAWIGPALFRDRFGRFDRASYIEGGIEIEYRLRLGENSFLRVKEFLRARAAGEGAPALERALELLGCEPFGSTMTGSEAPRLPGEILILAAPHLAGFTGPPAELEAAAAGASIARLPCLTWPRGRLRAEGGERAAWTIAPGTIHYPVLQPFTDDPIAEGSRFPPLEEPGGGRLAVALGTAEASSAKRTTLKLIYEIQEEKNDRPKAGGGSGQGVNEEKAISLGPPPIDAEVSCITLPEGYAIERFPLPDDFLPCAVAHYRGQLLVAGYDGEVRWAFDSDGDGLPDRYRHFGGPLDQADSMLVRGDEVMVASPGAVYALRDRDGDGRADDYRTLSSDWDWAGHPFDWFFGFAADRDGNLYGSNSTPFERGNITGNWRRGGILKIAPGGATSLYATGMRYEFGWTTDRSFRSFFTINQGHYNITCAIHELVEGACYGYGEKDLSKVAAPVVRVPYPWCHALTGIAVAETGGRFGVFENQGLAADYNTRRLIRWTHYQTGALRQGACYEFCDGLEAGPTGLAFGPDGALYVPFMADGAWYPSRPRGGIYRIKALPQKEAPDGKAAAFDILEARLRADGFDVTFTQPVNPESVPGSARKVHRYFHEYRGEYHAAEIEHEDVPVAEAALDSSGRTLHLRLERPHAVPRIYRLRFEGLCSRSGKSLKAGAFYVTAHGAPRE